jgi:hypothetical protein
VNNELESAWKLEFVTNLRLALLFRNILVRMENLNQYGWCRDLNLKPGPPEYEALDHLIDLEYNCMLQYRVINLAA